ncbi:MAG: 3'-5' exoribonuclease YhaM family protein [Myxococcaceae bacterium]
MNTPSETTAPASAESAETIRKVYVRDLHEKDPVHTVFRVAKKNKISGRSGRSFVALVLADKTGEVDGRIFDNVDQLEPSFAAGDYVLAKGSVISFHNELQVLVDGLERLDPEPIDRAEFAYQAPPAAKEGTAQAEGPPAPDRHTEKHAHGQGGRAVGHIREMVERVSDPNVRALLLAFLDDPDFGPGLAIAPAGKGIHHAYKGGLADHILSSMKLAHRIADHYPQADRDLLLAGALLHDIGKVKELTYDRGNFDYSDEGRLVGHLVITAQKIREKASAISGFPPLLEQHITHIVLAHHGHLEYGSPKLPATLEALLVHLIDLMDSRVASWLEIMAKDTNDKWTDVSRLYERHLWKGPVPTARGKSPVEGRGGGNRRRDENRKKQGGPKPAAEGQQHRPERPRREKRPEGGAAPKPGGSGLPSELTFKPFNALATPAAEDEPQSE